ncbi:gasdermin-E-like isoform 1-T2 [Menidia menidia]
MFSKATANFVQQVDPEGSLIHVSRVNNSHKLVPLGLVVKRNRIWVWQKPKYQPTDFTLIDLLQGGEALEPGLTETEFLTYEGTYSDDHGGTLQAEAGPADVTLGGRGTSKLQAGLGKLKKQELDVNKLLSDSQGRSVDMSHVLVRQLDKRAEVLGVVKERILTTSPCSITLKKTQKCAFRVVLRLLCQLGSSVKVCVKDINNIEVGSDVLEIPSDTVIAYSILELEIRKSGRFDICLQPGTSGGFEEDSAFRSISPGDTVDGKINDRSIQGEAPPSNLHNGSQKSDLLPLAELPQPIRNTLFEKLQEILGDRAVLLYLQCVLEELRCGRTVDTAILEELPEIVDLHLLDSARVPEHTQSDVPAHLKAAHMLLSAMEELSDETLSLLSDSQPDFLAAMDALMSSEPFSFRPLPGLLLDNQAFQQAEQLLASVGTTLTRDGERLWMETGNDAGVGHLVLSLCIHGLTLLSAEES